MADAKLCASAAAALAALPASHAPQVMVGFDGFIDNIIDVVATRESRSSYQAMPTLAEFGKRIGAAAGESANFEMVIKTSKIGGNGPIMANALASYACAVTSIGLLGEDAIDPVFAPLAQRATTISLGRASVTDALEFSDGKLMLGKLQPMDAITFDRLITVLGKAKLCQVLRQAHGIATVNWTMTLGMTEIWKRLASDILPGLRPDRPLWFVDLADPAKRTVADVRDALSALQAIQQHADVILGLNGAECRQILKVLDEKWPEAANEWESARGACATIQKRLGCSWVMCHLVRAAACAWAEQGGGSIGVDGFFEPKPLITTGAGDHFNAGFLAARLAGLEPSHCLVIGGATSGYYVRSGISPSRAQTHGFLTSFA